MTPEEAVLKHLAPPDDYGMTEENWGDILKNYLTCGCDWLEHMNEWHNPIPGEAVKALCLRHEAVIAERDRLRKLVGHAERALNAVFTEYGMANVTCDGRNAASLTVGWLIGYDEHKRREDAAAEAARKGEQR